MQFFEGSEKKIEVVFHRKDLRSLGDQYWRDVITQCNATIISKISSSQVDAYLLSESSLFVWDDYILIITCGKTLLINSIEKLIKDFGVSSIRSLIFQRKNEYHERLQDTSFFDDALRVSKIFDKQVSAYQLGHLDAHHNFLLHLKQSFDPPQTDRTCELLMYHLEGEASDFFQHYRTVQEVRSFLGLDEILNGWTLDDFSFKPVGYSLNGLKDNRYVTIHITPQEGSSYVSFETNLDTEGVHGQLLDHFIHKFRPGCFDLIAFNHCPNLSKSLGTEYQQSYEFKENLSCGYEVRYSVFQKLKIETGRGRIIQL